MMISAVWFWISGIGLNCSSSDARREGRNQTAGVGGVGGGASFLCLGTKPIAKLAAIASQKIQNAALRGLWKSTGCGFASVPKKPLPAQSTQSLSPMTTTSRYAAVSK